MQRSNPFSPDPGRILLWGAIFLFPPLFGFFTFFGHEILSGFREMKGGRIDSRYVIYVLEHWFRWFHGQGSLVSPPAYYPVRGTLGFASASLAMVPFFCAFRSLHLDAYSATQGAYLVSGALNYLTCLWLFHRGLKVGLPAASVGAAFFAFNSVNFNHLGHFNFMPLFLLPPVFGILLDCRRNAFRDGNGPMAVRLALVALLTAVQMMTAFYIGWFLLFWCLLFLLSAVAFPPTRDLLARFAMRYWPALTAAFCAFLLGMVPFYFIYQKLLMAGPLRDYGEVEQGMPSLLSLLWMGPTNHLWGWLDPWLGLKDLPLEGEKRLGLGLVFSLVWVAVSSAAFLDLVRVVRGKAPDLLPRLFRVRGQGAYWLLAAVLSSDLFVLLALKVGPFSLWRIVYLTVPGAQAMRVTSRFLIFLALPMALVLSVGFQSLLDRAGKIRGHSSRNRALGVLALSVLILAVEQGGKAQIFFDKGQDAAWVRELSDHIPRDATAFFLVIDPRVVAGREEEYQLDAMMVAQWSGIPTLNGYSGVVPPGWQLDHVRDPNYGAYALQWIAQNKLGPKVFALRIGPGD